MSLRMFVLPPHSSAQEVTDMVNTLRTIFDLRFIQPGQTAGVVEIRASAPVLEACTRLLAQLDNDRPQVMLDVHVFQISHMLTRNIGVHIPNTFNMYNIPAAALVGLAGQNIQNLINQLIALGWHQPGRKLGALGDFWRNLTGQQNSISPASSLATFGGGLTFMGLSLDKFAAALSVNESWARVLEQVTHACQPG